MLAAQLLDIKWHYLFNPELGVKSLPYILDGLGNTLTISLISFLGAVLGGSILAWCRLTTWTILDYSARIYTSFFRGVPVLVTLFFLYFGLPLMGLVLSAYTASVIGLSLTTAAYTAEIMRSAIMAVDKGQWEASSALGLRQWQTLAFIVLPQAGRIAIPPLSNVLLDLVKTSSIAAMISVPELFMKAKNIGAAEHDFMTTYIVVAILYWLICTVYSWGQSRLEAHFSLDL